MLLTGCGSGDVITKDLSISETIILSNMGEFNKTYVRADIQVMTQNGLKTEYFYKRGSFDITYSYSISNSSYFKVEVKENKVKKFVIETQRASWTIYDVNSLN